MTTRSAHFHLILVLALTGCAEAIPVYLNTFDSVETPCSRPSPEVLSVLDVGFNIWGLTYELVEDGASLAEYGAVSITIVPGERDTEGTKIDAVHQDNGLCRTHITTIADGPILGHELGHVWLGTAHSDDEENIMHTLVNGYDITDEQLDDAERSINLFRACIDGA